MSLLEFAKNNPDLITLLVSTVGGLIWHRGKQVKLADLWDTLLKVGYQVLPKLLEDPKLFDDAYVRLKLRNAIEGGLGRLGIKTNPTIEKLIDEAVEHVHGELAEALWKRNVDKFIEVQGKTNETLKEASTR